jgi:hypothetical protein
MAIKKASSQTWINKGTASAAVSSYNIITTAPFSASQIVSVPSGYEIPSTPILAASGGSIYPYTPNGPNIATVTITNSSYVPLDDTALSTTGGYLVIGGTGFVNGAVAYVQGVAAFSTTVVSSTEIRVQTATISSGLLQVYVINPDGSIGFKISGIISSGTPNWITTSPLEDQLDNLAFSISLTANSDSTITYALGAGSSLPSNTSLSSTGVFSGTIGNLSIATTYSFVVVATDLELQDTSKTFVVNVQIGDPFFRDVQIFLKADSNTWITDTSNNKFIANITGDARPMSFSPFDDDGVSGSAYFDGTGDFLEWPNNNAFGMATGDFTIEGWVYYIGGSRANNKYFIDFHPATTGALYPSISANATGNIIFKTDMTSNLIVGNAITTNAWHHIAVSRYLSNTRLFLDGELQGVRLSDANNYLPGPVRVGRNNDGTAENAFNGFMSNLRITKNVAYYQTNTSFTPSTTPLIADITNSNTSLLTLQYRMGENGNRFVDTSAANSTTKTSIVTKGGGALMAYHSPVTKGGWSSMFDSSQVLSYSTPPLVIANANTGIVNTFTIETWMFGSYQFYGNPFYFYYSDAGFYFFTNASDPPTTAGRYLQFQWNVGLGAARRNAVMTLETGNSRLLNLTKWNHIALVCNQNVLKMFINGVDYTSTATYSEDSVDYPLNVSANTNLNRFYSLAGDWQTLPASTGWVGGLSGNMRLSDYRISNRAVYWERNFTLPSRPYGSPAGTKIYAHNSQRVQDNNTQESIKFNAIEIFPVPDGPYTQTSPYSPASVGGSVFLDGTGDFIAITPYNVSPTSANTNLSVRDQDFCFEFWFNDMYSSSASTRILVDTRGTGTSVGQWHINHNSPSRILQLYMATDASSSTWTVVNGLNIGQVSAYQWIHVAVYRIGNTVFASCNGIVTVANTGIGTASLWPLRNDMTLGISSQDKSSSTTFGYFGPTRLVIGDSVYAANVCPIPTRTFERTANTKLLLNFDTNGIYDVSGGTVQFEAVGGVRVRNTKTKFANNSIYFDGTGYLSERFHNFQGGAGQWIGSRIGYGEFTIEMWLNRNRIGNQQNLVDWRTTEPNANPLLYFDTSNQLQWWISGVTRIVSAPNAVPANTWTHVAISRSHGSGTKMFINGLQVGVTYADPVTIYGSGRVTICGDVNGGLPYTGYMEDLRITLGYARYTTNTSPPTRAFSIR